jgi:hypothetical protein
MGKGPKARVKSSSSCSNGAGRAIDMFDRKPDAPEAYRGLPKGVPTSMPGLHVCEGLSAPPKSWTR